ncbi:unnamed protein product [Coregonus sp. 'balchen']|nr:unnamed protein product [Coregonus sp. 'balchen']
MDVIIRTATQPSGAGFNNKVGGASVALSATSWFAFLYGFALLSITQFPTAMGDCWLIEGEKGFVWLAICSQNQPPYEAIPAHINSTIVDLRLNENKIKSIHFSSLSRFGNLTYLNLTKNEISYVLQLGFNRLRNLTEGILRGLGKLQYLYLQANLIEAVTPNTFEECPNIENIDLSMNRIQVLDGGLFTGLSRLTTCELYTNPFNCSCDLLGKAGLERTPKTSSPKPTTSGDFYGQSFSRVLSGFGFPKSLGKKGAARRENKKFGKRSRRVFGAEMGTNLGWWGKREGGGSILNYPRKVWLSAGRPPPGFPYLPQGGTCEMDQEYTKWGGNWGGDRAGDRREREREREREKRGGSFILPPKTTPGSVAEISTIASEVDKVNQIINNCIDVLKSESTSFQGVRSGSVSTADPQLVLISDQPQRQSGFLSPQYKGGYHHPLQRHHSMEAPSKRPSTSSSGSVRSPRSFRSDGPYRGPTETKYIEKTSPAGTGITEDTILTVTPAAAILRAEAQKVRQYTEQRHSYPGPQHPLPDPEELEELSSSKPSSILEPLTLGRHPRELAYAQLSPQYHNLSYESSPEYSCTPSLGIWERFKLHRKRHKDEDYEEEYMAAGHALRRSLQVAKDEDLHDILDYWKGVSAQQKS